MKLLSKNKRTTPSITEWIKKTTLPNTERFLVEDNNKYSRLKILKKIIKLPLTPIDELTTDDILKHTPLFTKILKKRGGKQCILRLVPMIPSLPKIRKKGNTLNNNLKWFNNQKRNIDLKKYKVEIIPRCNKIAWASIFIINDAGAWGEIIRGGLSQLIRGNCYNTPIMFSTDFKKIILSKEDKEARKFLKKAINKLRVTKYTTKKLLRKKLNSKFNKYGYIKGYFEFTVWYKKSIKFIDYNRLQDDTLKNYNVWDTVEKKQEKLLGICVGSGIAQGVARVVTNPKKNHFEKGDILITKMITIDYIPLMVKAGAIVTERGTILSHAAIISRELKKPYIAAVKNATKKIKDGKKIFINANKGIIRILK